MDQNNVYADDPNNNDPNNAGARSDFEVTSEGRLREQAITKDERDQSLFIHLSALLHIMFPVIAIVLPIVLWDRKRNESRFVADHGREAINFQITLIIYSALVGVVSLLLVPVIILTLGLALLLYFPLVAFPYALGIWGMIRACRAATQGEYMRYPMTIRFLKPHA